jgi:hypothetical protein
MKGIIKRSTILGIVLSSFFFTRSFAQRTETSLSFNSGLFSFSGQTAGSTTFVNYDPTSKSGYTNNPYGSKNALCYGFSLASNRIARWNLILGIDAGYEVLRSKIMINQIAVFDGNTNNNYPAAGKSISNYAFLNFFPHIGYRIKIRNISFDFTGGFELAFNMKSWKTGSATTASGSMIQLSSDNNGSNLIDIRRRIQLAVNYKKISPYIGYSTGLLNYNTGKVGGNYEAYSRMIRVGITYKIK